MKSVTSPSDCLRSFKKWNEIVGNKIAFHCLLSKQIYERKIIFRAKKYIASKQFMRAAALNSYDGVAVSISK